MIQVIERAFNILEFIASQEEKYISLSKISSSVDLHKATCSNIIKTMVKRNYLEKSENHNGYGLGFMTHNLTGKNNDTIQYALLAKDDITQLRDDLGEGCLLATLRGKMRINVYKANTKKELRILILDEKSAYQTASGRMLLASLNKEQRSKFIEDFGLPSKEEWQEVKNKKALFEKLDQIKKDKFCIRESPEGIIGYAVPVPVSSNRIFALGVFLPSVRWNDKTRTQIGLKVNHTARIISKSFSEL